MLRNDDKVFSSASDNVYNPRLSYFTVAYHHIMLSLQPFAEHGNMQRIFCYRFTGINIL